MNALRMAWRSLMRNPRRTILTAMALANAVAGGLLFYGFTRDTFWGLAETFARGGNGHVQIADATWFDDPAPELHRVPRATLTKLQSALSADPEIGPALAGLSIRRQVAGLLVAGDRSGIFLGTGTDPAAEPAIAPLAHAIAGSDLDNSHPEGVTLGAPLAARLGVGPGSVVTALVTTDDGLTNAMDLHVAGISRTGSEDLDRTAVALPLDTALSLVDGANADVLVLALHETGDTDRILASMQGILADPAFNGLAARPWYVRARYYVAVHALYDRIFAVFEGLMALVTVLSLSHAVSAVVAERRTEIAMLRVVGLRRRDVAGIFVAEGMLVGVLGCILGVLVAFGIAFATTQLGGISMPPPPGFTVGYAAHFRIDMLGYAIVLPISLAATVIASVVPAVRASRGALSRALAGLLILVIAFPAHASDRCRLDVSVHEGPNALDWRIAAEGSNTLAVTTNRGIGKRQAVLRRGRDTWFQTEKMAHPLKVGLSQRVDGQLSLADIVDPRQLAGWDTLSVNGETTSALARADSGLPYHTAEFDRTNGLIRAARFYGPSGSLVRGTAYRYEGERLLEVVVTDAAHPHSPIELYLTPTVCTLGTLTSTPETMMDDARRLAQDGE